jgi:hypothetical protein
MTASVNGSLLVSFPIGCVDLDQQYADGQAITSAFCLIDDLLAAKLEE